MSPNVVFILTDDQGPWAAGCYGNPEIRTPNIDRLAATGVRFDNFFCASPVCSPARASLLTGTIPSGHGVHDWIRDRNMPPDAVSYLEGQRTCTEVLAGRGYRLGLSGKWHLGDSLTPQAGFTHWFVHQQGGGPYHDAPMVRDGRAVTEPGYVTDVITDDALRFIDGAGDAPFYLGVHYTAPHSPWEGHPQDIVDSYDDCPFRSCPQEPMHPWAIGLTRQCQGNREKLKGYFAAVTAMDLNVGRILDRLEERGLRDHTLIVFTSDNGFSCGHHGFWGKGNGTFPLNMYDNSVKVPMIISHPARLPQGASTGAMMSQYDVMPTLLDYLGIEEPPHGAGGSELPGTSFVPVLEGEAAEAREDVVVHDEYGPVRMIRTPEWKYVHRYPYGAHELYDLTADPDERNNLVDERSRRPLVDEMRGRLIRWFDRYVDPRLDGTRFPVSGLGQLDRIGRRGAGESCFQDGEFGITASGFPAVTTGTPPGR